MTTKNDPAAQAAEHHAEIERLVDKLRGEAMRLLAQAEARGADRWARPAASATFARPSRGSRHAAAWVSGG